MDPLGSEQSLEDVESINEFEPLFAEEQPEVEKPVAAVQVWFLYWQPVSGVAAFWLSSWSADGSPKANIICLLLEEMLKLSEEDVGREVLAILADGLGHE